MPPVMAISFHKSGVFWDYDYYVRERRIGVHVSKLLDFVYCSKTNF